MRWIDLLREVAASGVVLDDERLDYVVVQVERWAWDEVRRQVRPALSHVCNALVLTPTLFGEVEVCPVCERERV